ncbi:hypothetical protein M1D46_00520 [Microbacterium sp. JZ70]
MILDKSIRVLAVDGSINAEVALRLQSTFRLTDTGWHKQVRPKVWSTLRPSVAEAVLQVAVKAVLEDIRKELHTRPGLTWEDKALIDSATADRERFMQIMRQLPVLLRRRA